MPVLNNIESGELTLPIAIQNSEMRVRNDQLDNDIAKLKGKKPDKNRLALDTEWLSSLRLAESIEDDLKLARVSADKNTVAQIDALRAEVYESLRLRSEKLVDPTTYNHIPVAKGSSKESSD